MRCRPLELGEGFKYGLPASSLIRWNTAQAFFTPVFFKAFHYGRDGPFAPKRPFDLSIRATAIASCWLTRSRCLNLKIYSNAADGVVFMHPLVASVAKRCRLWSLIFVSRFGKEDYRLSPLYRYVFICYTSFVDSY